MRRVLQLSGLSGLLMTGFLSTQAFAEVPKKEAPAATDTQRPAEESKAEQPAPAAPVVPAEAAAPAAAPAGALALPAAAFAPPVAGPKVGDTTAHGYFRGGWGASNQKGRMTCFGLSISGSLKSKYRLGNECEQWGELHLTTVIYAGEDGSVASLHFMPTAYIPTTYMGYSPTAVTNSPAEYTTATGATVAFPNLYADIKGISWLYGGTAWVGTRYYKRESVYISDFFYWNPSGVGGGIEDVTLGKIWGAAPAALSELRFSYGAFAVDGQPKSSDPSAPPFPMQVDLGIRNDVQVRGFRPYPGGELQIGFQYIKDWSNNKDVNGDSNTHSGWGITVRHVQEVLGGDNKLVFQYGKGGGTGFGTLSRFYYPDFSIYWPTTQSRLRLVDVLTIQPTAWLGTQVGLVYQKDDTGTGVSGAVNKWYSVGTRVAVALSEHFKVLGEAGYDRIDKSNGSDPLWLAKFTVAPVIAAGKGFWTRPELRLFYTWAMWNEAASRETVDSGRIYTDMYPTYLSGATFGLQAEAMW